LLALNDRSDLVGLKLRGPEPRYFFIVEATTVVARFFQPTIDRIKPMRSTWAIADLFNPSTLRVAT
jgi:hypothetical protein